ncbi:MAG: hypothetical protein IH862_02070 [Chloroflexi bacterium]|nr:hypothetical protein [Chloroflexota bacterium]
MNQRQPGAVPFPTVHARPDYLTADGRCDFARLVGAASFPVYGLKGRPLGLRLKTPGCSASGLSERIYSIDLGYVSGNAREPDGALQVSRLASDRPVEELDRVEHLVLSYCSQEQSQEYRRAGSFHRDWNEDVIGQATRRQMTVHVGGRPVEVELRQWEQPQRVILTNLSLGEELLTADSLSLSISDLLDSLMTLVVLQDDAESMQAHQRDIDETRRETRGESGPA